MGRGSPRLSGGGGGAGGGSAAAAAVPPLAANCLKVGGIRLTAQPGTGRGDTFPLGLERGGVGGV